MRNPITDDNKPAVSVVGGTVYYKSELMEEGKLYRITWYGEKWALRKTGKEVEFLKWEED